ncbi:hypothetical protein BJ085DRAFT_36702 [Dimargaris cristalligena]|uniref:PB1 domain-containing protein n=1 Tax=Dimargaris cristalligena TaxID=215637 RepID=A0A4P9ZJ97_9FUNG|nr:hypothetical protein BJ085DRAFT_36702 [Dimargaris cristalligena]|eukprot:RKP33284.1 hypothetical protein BJ085DRAFT_36702 [Dimargaris cristalligena]
MTDLNLAESQLNQINRRPSFNPAGNPGMPPPRMHRLHSHDPPGQASRPMHRSPSLANRSLPSLGSPTMAGEAHPGGNHAGAYPAHELPNASPTLSAGGAPLLRNGSIAGQHHPGPAFGGDDNASMYDMAPRPKLNVPKGKTAVKIHYHNDIIKLLVDARISYDDLLSKIRAKIAAHLQKAADRSRRPSAASESEPPGRAEMGSPSSLGQAESDGQAGGGPLGVAAGITSWWNGSQGGQPGYGTNQAYLSPPTSSANLPSSPGAQMALATVQNIRVKYRDEDDELVLMTDQEDFEMAKGYMGGDMSCPDTNVVERLELWCEN